jgi:TolA-binding protein
MSPKVTALLLSLLVGGCIPTLSKQRGEEHVRALERGDRLHAEDDYDGAAQAYARAASSAERRVDREEALYRRARSLRRAGRLEEAVRVLDEIAAAEPVSRNTVRARYDAARIRIELGDREGGIAGLMTVIREHPDHGNALHALAIVADDAEAEGGVAARRRLLEELDPQIAQSELHDDLLFALAELELEQDDRQAGRRALERIVDEHPYPQGNRWDEALLRLADLAEEDGDPAGAIEHLEALTLRHEGTWSPGSYTRPSMPRAQLRIARLERDERGDLDRAASAYRRLYDDYPTSTLRDDALFELGDLEERRGDHDAACDLYRRVVEEFEVGRARREAERRLSSC